MPNRLSRAPYAAAWALLFGGQIAVIALLLPISVGWGLAALVALQLLKIPVTVARLDDLGRAPDDAILALVPLASLGLWLQALAPTPDPAARERLRTQWVGQIGSLKAFGLGLQGIFASTTAGVPVAVASGTLLAVLDRSTLDWITALGARPPESRELVAQVLLAVSGLLGLYTLVQIAKGRNASRASWLPSFFLPIPLFLYMTLQIVSSSDPSVTGNPMIPLLTSGLVWQITWGCVGGAALGVLWVQVALAQQQGRLLGIGEALSHMGRRTADVSAPHGAATLAILVGMQVIIPGIYYGLQFAFVDAAAVLHPDVPALRRSTQLTQGIRRRMFKVYALAFLTSFAVAGLGCFLVETWLHEAPMAEAAQMVAMGVMLNQLFPFDELSTGSLVIVWTSTVLAMGAARVGLTHMYMERVARNEKA